MLDNRLIDYRFPPAYYCAMTGIAFRQRVLAEMAATGISKAELSRISGVPYHAIDKFLKREGATTSTENAIALANALKISVDSGQDYDELRALFEQLGEEKQRYVLASLRGLLG